VRGVTPYAAKGTYNKPMTGTQAFCYGHGDMYAVGPLDLAIALCFLEPITHRLEIQHQIIVGWWLLCFMSADGINKCI
jgi:hypothetical protein